MELLTGGKRNLFTLRDWAGTIGSSLDGTWRN